MSLFAGELIALGSLLVVFVVTTRMLNSYTSSAMFGTVEEILRSGFFVAGVISAILAALISGTASLIISNRIAGPIYRMKRICHRVGEGDLSVKVEFRRKDILRFLKVVLQDMISGLKAKEFERQQDLMKISSSCQEILVELEDEAIPASVRIPMISQINLIRETALNSKTQFIIYDGDHEILSFKATNYFRDYHIYCI